MALINFNVFFLEEFSRNIPKSPLSLLHVKFPKSVKFGKATIESRNRVTVTVTIQHMGANFSVDGYGKNRYWAKNSAARRALKRQI